MSIACCLRVRCCQVLLNGNDIVLDVIELQFGIFRGKKGRRRVRFTCRNKCASIGKHSPVWFNSCVCSEFVRSSVLAYAYIEKKCTHCTPMHANCIPIPSCDQGCEPGSLGIKTKRQHFCCSNLPCAVCTLRA